jgi:hypothetical protein
MIMPLADEVRTVGHMRITFHRFPDHSSAYSVIERDDGVVYRMKEFTRAGTELPHDLRHFVVERELGITNGIWGGIAATMPWLDAGRRLSAPEWGSPTSVRFSWSPSMTGPQPSAS